MKYLIFAPIIVPLLSGILLLILPERLFLSVKTEQNCISNNHSAGRVRLCAYTGISLVVSGIMTVLALFYAFNKSVPLFDLTKNLTISFKIDVLSCIFVSIVTVVWIAAGFFSFTYMKHEQKEKRYYGIYLMVLGILAALDFAENLVTFYAFYELMTLISMPLVLHNQTREAIMAGLKYLFYSFAGAYMVLFGFYFLNQYATTLTFTSGGVLNMTLVSGHESLLLVCAFLMIIGFGVKAGMFPMHGWLPTAHPVAPAPASAVLSGIIVKAGVLGMIRVVYYMFGVDFLMGTWVQYAWLTLSLITVFMGSMLAYREKVFKKRLAYSTVSQVSYILFGLALMNTEAFTGSLLHVICHAFVKAGLFLCAGAIIYVTGETRVDKLAGIGKKMPVLLWCYTFLSLALIGIPPMGGFISKWHLAIGSLESGIQVFSWLGPVILLVSALLTAGYLLPISIHGFLPGKEYDPSLFKKQEPTKWMLIPILILTIITALLGLFPNAIIQLIHASKCI